MTEALEIRTPHADVFEVVRELAPSVDDLAIRLPCERPIADGQWVRFTVLLADGSTVFEGLGRSVGTRPDGSGLRVQLAQLQFDERNEVMYERMLLARDAAEETGTIELHEVGAELVRGGSRSAPPPPPPRPSAPPPKLQNQKPPRAPPLPPPPPSERASERPRKHTPTKASTPPKTRSQATSTGRPGHATPSARPAPSSQSARTMPPRATLASVAPERGAASSEPAAPSARRTPSPAKRAGRTITPLPNAARPPSATSESTPVSKGRTSAKASERALRKAPVAAQTALSGGAADEVVRIERPAPRSGSGPPKPRPAPPSAEPSTTAEHRGGEPLGEREARPLRLEIPKGVVAHAHLLASILPAGVVDPRGAPEEAVLRTALRLGLATLSALAEDDES